MENIEKKRKWNIHFLRDMKFKQRMIIIFLIGCILPLLCTSLYTNYQTQNIMLNLSKETQLEELSLVGQSIQESMTVLEKVAENLVQEKKIQRLATKKYKGYRAFLKDCNSLDAISNYLTYYQQDISKITIYIDNNSVEPGITYQTSYMAYLGDAIRSQSWYREMVKQKTGGSWSYVMEPETKSITLQITQPVRDSSGNVLAVVAVMLQPAKTSEAIDKRSIDTMLLYNNDRVICSNTDVSAEYPFLIERVSEYQGDAYSQKITYGVEEYLLTYQKVSMTGSDKYYSLVSIQKYQNILATVNSVTLRAFLPVLFGALLSLILIFTFAFSYEHRIALLREQMHYVAQGEYDQVETLEGNDEIGELYQELEQMMKDIQQLMADVVNEQVQKEKLHTRQKEVEFKMLASQINPHFLYNTLETIRMKAMVNKEPEIEELVKMLAKIMRYNIQVTDQPVTLTSEIQLVQYYLKIQNYRFGDRITSEVMVDPNVDRKAVVMPLIIQPFVENAFVHGLEEKDADGLLKIHVSQQDDTIYIRIRDNGVGMDYYELGRLRKSMREEDGDQSHIGVRNVNQRIRIQYGEEYGVKVNSEVGSGTTVILKLPYLV